MVEDSLTAHLGVILRNNNKAQALSWLFTILQHKIHIKFCFTDDASFYPNPCCKMRIWETSILSSIFTCKCSSSSGSTGSLWLILLRRCPISAAQLSTPPRSSSIFSRLPESSVVSSAAFVLSSPSCQWRARWDVHSHHLPTALLQHSHHLGHFPALALNRDQRRNKCQTYWQINQVRLSSSALRVGGTAKPVPYTLSPCPLLYKQPHYYGENSWAAASPSPQQGIAQEQQLVLVKSRSGRVPTLMALAVLGHSSSTWSCILY